MSARARARAPARTHAPRHDAPHAWRRTEKVLKRLGFQLTHEQIADIVASKPGVVEQFLRKLRKHVRARAACRARAAVH